LTSLAGLEALQSVNSLVLNTNNSLTDISALLGLTTVGPTIDILGNDNLASLHGLENVVDLSATDVGIEFAPVLTDIGAIARQHVHSLTVTNSGLTNFLSWSSVANPVIDSLVLEQDNALTGLTGLGQQTGGLSAATRIVILQNPVLSDVSALGGLTSLGDLDIEECPGIGSLAIPNVTSAGNIILKVMPQTDLPTFGTLSVVNSIDLENIGMTSLAGLATVQTVNGNIVIIDNALLNSNGAFGPFTVTGFLDAENNVNWPSCQVDDIALRASITSTEINIGNSSSGLGCG
jgi:hypothetical protein